MGFIRPIETFSKLPLQNFFSKKTSQEINDITKGSFLGGVLPVI